MEPPRKKARLTSNNQWNPIELTFLLGTKSPISSIHHAFGVHEDTGHSFHSLSERQIIRLIFDFQKWPKELRTFRPPYGYNRNEDDKPLPLLQDDGRMLIMYCKRFDYLGDDIEMDEEDLPFLPFWILEVYYDLTTELFERYSSSFNDPPGTKEIDKVQTFETLLDMGMEIVDSEQSSTSCAIIFSSV